MMTKEQYFGSKQHGEMHEIAALDLLGRRNALRLERIEHVQDRRGFK